MKRILVIVFALLQMCQIYANAFGTEESIDIYYYKPKGIGNGGANKPSKGPAHSQVNITYDKERQTLCIKNAQGTSVECYLYDSDVQLLLSVSCSEANTTIDVSHLSNGEYHIYVVDNDNVFRGNAYINNAH